MSVRDVPDGNKVSRGQISVECCEGQGRRVTRGYPALPGCHDEGELVDEALIPIRDATRDTWLFIDRAHQSWGMRVMEITILMSKLPVISGLPTVKAFMRDGNAKTWLTRSHLIMVTHGMNVTLYDCLFSLSRGFRTDGSGPPLN